MIYKTDIIYKQYLLDNVSKIEVLLDIVWNFAVTGATYYFLVTDCAPGTRDETKQGYLPCPVRDPEQRRAAAARGVRRGMHGMG